MSNIAAALGVSQLQKIDKIIAQRRKNAAYLNKKLNILEDKIVLPGSLKNYFHVFQMYTIMVKDGEKTRNNLKNYLEKNGITAKIYFDPVHLSAFYRRKFAFQKGALPITEKIAQEALSLPLYPGLTQKEMDYIANNLISFFRK